MLSGVELKGLAVDRGTPLSYCIGNALTHPHLNVLLFHTVDLAVHRGIWEIWGKLLSRRESDTNEINVLL